LGESFVMKLVKCVFMFPTLNISGAL